MPPSYYRNRTLKESLQQDEVGGVLIRIRYIWNPSASTRPGMVLTHSKIIIIRLSLESALVL